MTWREEIEAGAADSKHSAELKLIYNKRASHRINANNERRLSKTEKRTIILALTRRYFTCGREQDADFSLGYFSHIAIKYWRNNVKC